MDTNKILQELLSLSAEVLVSTQAEPHVEQDPRMPRMAHLVVDLSSALTVGHPLPTRWLNANFDDAWNRYQFTVDRNELGRLLNENAQLYEQVTNTQRSNTALVEENRALKARVQELYEANQCAVRWVLGQGTEE